MVCLLRLGVALSETICARAGEETCDFCRGKSKRHWKEKQQQPQETYQQPSNADFQEPMATVVTMPLETVHTGPPTEGKVFNWHDTQYEQSTTLQRPSTAADIYRGPYTVVQHPSAQPVPPKGTNVQPTVPPPATYVQPVAQHAEQAATMVAVNAEAQAEALAGMSPEQQVARLTGLSHMEQVATLAAMSDEDAAAALAVEQAAQLTVQQQQQQQQLVQQQPMQQLVQQPVQQPMQQPVQQPMQMQQPAQQGINVQPAPPQPHVPLIGGYLANPLYHVKNCGYCSQLKTVEVCADGHVRIQCGCGGVQSAGPLTLPESASDCVNAITEQMMESQPCAAAEGKSTAAAAVGGADKQPERQPAEQSTAQAAALVSAAAPEVARGEGNDGNDGSGMGSNAGNDGSGMGGDEGNVGGGMGGDEGNVGGSMGGDDDGTECKADGPTSAERTVAMQDLIGRIRQHRIPVTASQAFNGVAHEIHTRYPHLECQGPTSGALVSLARCSCCVSAESNPQL